MPCLNLDLEYPNHPKIRRLVGRLGPPAEILPIKLWCYVGRVHPGSGELKGYTVQEIEHLMGWTGGPGKAVEALVAVQLLEEIAGGYRVHHWQEHEGHLVAFKNRALQANLTRWRKLSHRPQESPSDSASGKDPSRIGQGSRRKSLKAPPTSPSKPGPAHPDHAYPAPPTAPGAAAAAEATGSDADHEAHPGRSATATPATPGQDLEAIIYDRIGWKRRLSKAEWDKLLELKRTHPPGEFYRALDRLHSGVVSVPAYLEAVLNPETRAEAERQEFTRKLAAIVAAQGCTNRKEGQLHGTA